MAGSSSALVTPPPPGLVEDRPRSDPVGSALQGGALGLHEVSSPTDPYAGRCERWPEGAALLNVTTGELVRGRCKSPNLCAYCARLAAIEWTEMLAIDSMTAAPPVVWCCLGTALATLDTAAFYNGRKNVMRRLRRWAERVGLDRIEYLCIVEFTTGYGPRSGGLRRPHWNILLKGVPLDRIEDVRALIVETWCESVDGAAPQAQHVGEVAEAGGLMRYLALHFLKESQQPPKGWKGQRVTYSGGYWAGGVHAIRAQAKHSLSVKREVWKLEGLGCPLEVAIDLAREDVAARESEVWAYMATASPWSGRPIEVVA